MATQIQKWQAQDGTEFNSESEADAHDAEARDQERIGAYLDAREAADPADFGPRTRSRITRDVLSFLAWERTRS